MISVLEYLDGLPWQPVALFGLGWLAFLLTVLSMFKPRHPDECPRCGGEWQRTPRGAQWHLCEERDDEPTLANRLLSLSIKGANDSRGPTP